VQNKSPLEGFSMTVRLHPHAQARLIERGATETEVIATVQTGKSIPAKFGRTEFRQTFPYNAEWKGKRYAGKQVAAIAVQDAGDWMVVTVIVKFF